MIARTIRSLGIAATPHRVAEALGVPGHTIIRFAQELPPGEWPGPLAPGDDDPVEIERRKEIIFQKKVRAGEPRSGMRAFEIPRGTRVQGVPTKNIIEGARAFDAGPS